MATSSTMSEQATVRTVILLRKSDKAKLRRLASAEKVTSAELIRRLIRSGDDFLRHQSEEQAVAASLQIISTAVTEANVSLSATLEKLDRLHEQLAGSEKRLKRGRPEQTQGEVA